MTSLQAARSVGLQLLTQKRCRVSDALLFYFGSMLMSPSCLSRGTTPSITQRLKRATRKSKPWQMRSSKSWRVSMPSVGTRRWRRRLIFCTSKDAPTTYATIKSVLVSLCMLKTVCGRLHEYERACIAAHRNECTCCANYIFNQCHSTYIPACAIPTAIILFSLKREYIHRCSGLRSKRLSAIMSTSSSRGCHELV